MSFRLVLKSNDLEQRNGHFQMTAACVWAIAGHEIISKGAFYCATTSATVRPCL